MNKNFSCGILSPEGLVLSPSIGSRIYPKLTKKTKNCLHYILVKNSTLFMKKTLQEFQLL